MTKREMAKIIVDSPVYYGVYSVSDMVKNCTKEEIKDMYDELEFLEMEYYEGN